MIRDVGGHLGRRIALICSECSVCRTIHERPYWRTAVRLSDEAFLGFCRVSGESACFWSRKNRRGSCGGMRKPIANSQFDVGNDPTGPYRKHGDLKFRPSILKKAFKFAIEEDKPPSFFFSRLQRGSIARIADLWEDGTMSRPQIEERLWPVCAHPALLPTRFRFRTRPRPSVSCSSMSNCRKAGSEMSLWLALVCRDSRPIGRC